MTALVFGLPPTEAHYEHPKRLILRPESVFDAGTNKELVMGAGMMDLPIQLQMGPIIKEMEKLMANVVRVQTGTFAGTNKRQIDRALLVANYHVDIAPWAHRLDCLFSASRIHEK